MLKYYVQKESPISELEVSYSIKKSTFLIIANNLGLKHSNRKKGSYFKSFLKKTKKGKIEKKEEFNLIRVNERCISGFHLPSFLSRDVEQKVKKL